jgi:hypothetical protein
VTFSPGLARNVKTESENNKKNGTKERRKKINDSRKSFYSTKWRR